MDNGFVVGCSETLGDLHSVLGRAARGQNATAEPFAQRHAFQQFRDDVVGFVLRADVVHRKYVGMIQRPYSTRLLFEPPKTFSIAGEGLG